MKFRCPNCRQQILVEESISSHDDKTIHSLTCPSCNSQVPFAETQEATTVLQVGRVLGQYELRDLLGEGAFGSVFRAWDEKLQRLVALKIPRAGTMNGEVERSFLKEARLAAGISHPNVVGVHDIGRIEDTWFIATQLIEGISLRELLKTKTLPERDAVEMVIRMLRGIQSFHDKGIIHRDLKPGNILVDSSGNPFIADFGLARRLNPSEVSVSNSGQVVGTILYMSPEQARGESADLTNRSDLYSMGVVLYEMLSGRRPFEATDSRTVLYRIMTEEPAVLTRDGHRLPRDLQTICLKSLSKDPLRRYASAMEMADDLRRYLDGKPILARPVSLLEKSLKLVRRNPLLTAVSAVAFVAASTAAALYAVQPKDSRVPVVLETDSADAILTFQRVDSVLKVPVDGALIESKSGEETRLAPGLYRVTGRDPLGRFHEVWRTVPSVPTKGDGDHRFPFRSWRMKNSQITLPSFRLFADGDVEDSLVLVRGGDFEAGSDEQKGSLTARHAQSVQSLMVGINEVSFGQFRKVMNQPIQQEGANATYLSEFTRQYGDRADVPDTSPVTGYPIDVATVYCELAGGRLPTAIEWEFVATNGGTTKYSTGDAPPVNNPGDLKLLSVTDSTPDNTLSGIRNLCFSAGEITDTPLVHYSLLYPERFPSTTTGISREDLGRLPEMVELRGITSEWLAGGPGNGPIDPRARLVAPGPIIDLQAKEIYRHVGWRLFRRAK